MGLAYNTYLNCQRIYGCKYCKTHLSNQEDIMSRVSYLQVMPHDFKLHYRTNTGWGRTSVGNMERHFYSVKLLTLENPNQWNGI